jgi:hypothetical protein
VPIKSSSAILAFGRLGPAGVHLHVNDPVDYMSISDPPLPFESSSIGGYP